MDRLVAARRPQNCFVPDFVLVNIAANHPTQAVRARALRSLEVDASLRTARVAKAESRRFVRAARRVRRLAARASIFEALLEAAAQRTIYDANETQRLPGMEIRGEGDPATGDIAADEAYDGLGDTFDLYWDVYRRDSIDDEGLSLRATVHFGRDYPNAFWDGDQMVFGDGDIVLFRRFTIAVDVIGHELAHGVTEHEAGLIYWSQPGALNESISDVFGSLVKQFRGNERAADADWLIGEGLLAPGVNGVALRSMRAPGTAYDDPVLGKDPQPAHMDDYVEGLSDNGGVHINSGIPNHAFYRAADAIGGYAWERTGLIWYETLRSPWLRRTAEFTAFARLTVSTARRLFGPGSAEERAVRDGWGDVGIPV